MKGLKIFWSKNAQFSSFEEFMNHCISKKYTRSRIQRTCIHLLNQTTKKQVNALALPGSVRILGANEKGRKYLRKGTFPYASKFNQIEEVYRQMEYKAACLYSLALPEHLREDFTKESGGACFSMIFLCLILVIFLFLPIICFPSCKHEEGYVDCLIVLGCPAYDDGKMSITQKMRVEQAAKVVIRYKDPCMYLYRRKGA